jgi:hypothetical protein
LPGSLSLWNVLVIFCTSSPQQSVKCQRRYLG